MDADTILTDLATYGHFLRLSLTRVLSSSSSSSCMYIYIYIFHGLFRKLGSSGDQMPMITHIVICVHGWSMHQSLLVVSFDLVPERTYADPLSIHPSPRRRRRRRCGHSQFSGAGSGSGSGAGDADTTVTAIFWPAKQCPPTEHAK